MVVLPDSPTAAALLAATAATYELAADAEEWLSNVVEIEADATVLMGWAEVPRTEEGFAGTPE